MLGLSGLVVLGVDEIGDELEVTVETTTVRVGCRRCGVVAVLHDRRQTLVRDVDGSTGRSDCDGASGYGAAGRRRAHR